jgi:hypothetical protein
MVTGPERGSPSASTGRIVAAADLRDALRQALIEG